MHLQQLADEGDSLVGNGGGAGDSGPGRAKKTNFLNGRCPAPYYGGAAVKAGSRSGEGRTRPTGEGQKLDPGRVPAGDPTADKSGGFRPMNAERSGAIRTRGARATPKRRDPSEPRGRRKAPKIKYKSFGVPRPSTCRPHGSGRRDREDDDACPASRGRSGLRGGRALSMTPAQG